MPSAVPIKAVYRDVVVGIRYQHPLVIPQGTTPVRIRHSTPQCSKLIKAIIKTYRRIQMNFENSSSAAAFIDAIRLVCPCKETTGPSGTTQGFLPNRSMTLNMQGPVNPGVPGPMSHFNGISKQVGPSQTRTFMKPPGTFRRSVTKLPTQPVFGLKDDTQSQPRALVTATQPMDWDSLSSSAMAAPSDDILSSQQVTNTSITGSTPGGEVRSSYTRPAKNDVSFRDDQRPSNRRRILEADNTLPPSSLPDSSPPTSDTVVSCIDQPTTSTTERPCAPEPSLASPPDHNADILSSLQESITIYDLPKSELESLVAQIVREDSFAKLVRISPIYSNVLVRLLGFVARSC